MPQFPMTESRRRILERIPDYAVTLTPCPKRITISAGGHKIATSTEALLVSETRHDDVYYLPAADVDMSLLIETELSTYCPFKGHASYWSMKDGSLENVVWSYTDPYPEVAGLGGYLSFYADKVDITVE